MKTKLMITLALFLGLSGLTANLGYSNQPASAHLDVASLAKNSASESTTYVGANADLQLIAQQDGDADEVEEKDYFDYWYRDIRWASWVDLGADASTIMATLNEIEQAVGDRSNPEQFDTIIEFGPGHWTYEWSQVAEFSLASADLAAAEGFDELAHKQYVQAAIYFNIASYPNLNRPHEKEAFTKALEAYEKSGEYAAWTLEKVSIPVAGKTVDAFIHLPEASTETPLPVVMRTGGIDVTLVEQFEYFRDHFNEAGVALISFDIPGTGASGNFTLDENSHVIHEAVLDYLSTDKRFDPNRIAAFSSSMGGNSVVKLAVLEQDRLTAVVNRCGAIHGLLDAPAEAIAQLPDMTRDSFATRIGADLEDMDEIAMLAKPISLVNQGILEDGEIVTLVPILSLNTHNDPIFPPEDMLLVANSSLNGELAFSDAAGHCSDDPNEDKVIANWLFRQLNINQ